MFSISVPGYYSEVQAYSGTLPSTYTVIPFSTPPGDTVLTNGHVFGILDGTLGGGVLLQLQTFNGVSWVTVRNDVSVQSDKLFGINYLFSSFIHGQNSLRLRAKSVSSTEPARNITLTYGITNPKG